MIKIDIDDRQVQESISRMARAVSNPTPALRDMATALLSQVDRNFATESGPLGKWPVLKNPGERRKGGKLLQDTGRLSASVTPFWSATEAGIGTNVLYAAIHQFGGKTKPHTIRPRDKKALAFGGRVVKKVDHPGSVIPARPFLPVSPDGSLQDGVAEDLVEILADFIDRARR